MARPQLLTFGGHSDFRRYEAEFSRLTRGCQTIDPLGNRILFGPNDCLHVCYGGQKRHWREYEWWCEARAARIPWIKEALTNPTRIHADSEFKDRMRYLLVLAAEGSNAPHEFFCAIVRVEDKSTLQFITAYDIDAKQYAQYKGVKPQYFPVLPDVVATPK